MRRFLLFFSTLVVLFMTGCHTSHKATAHHSKNPKFIDDIYMDRHNKNSATQDGVDKKGKYVEKKHTEKGRGNSYADNDRTEVPKNLRDKYASILGVNKKEIINARLYKFIDEWMGVRHQIGGQDKNGIDCSGFSRKLYGEIFGVELIHSSSEQYDNSEHLKSIAQAKEGDLVFFRTSGKHVSHVGVYLMNDYFVHASTSQGVIISNLKEEYWQKHYVGAGRVPR